MHTTLRTGLALMFVLVARLAGAADLPPEQVTVATLPPGNPYRLYLADVAISHIVDGRLHVVDGDTLKYLGVIGTGLTGLTTLSPDRREIYVATTYLSRLNRGTRTDQIDVYDSQTLTLKQEIVIPPKHAQALPYKGVIVTTPDGRFIIVQNATPASSVSVVDRKSAKFVAEIPTPGSTVFSAPAAAVPFRNVRRAPKSPRSPESAPARIRTRTRPISSATTTAAA
jgi:methylamine dehydrogenase heavy chain